ncbi:YidC/Oxa1 family membrane protein insertase [Micromonospora sp. DT81.3]|uniref:YidC/Oxa1 family membrane protein insertase n=1 Tax=Micromonospora sp. DT81.3 TaxID=3416523 RepID=UPI003CFAC4D0
MDPFTLAPLAALLEAASGALLWVAATLQPLTGTSAAAAAIVLVTLLVRAMLVPTGIAQAKADQTRARLAPGLRALQRRHRDDPERLRRETMRLYADENASPLTGCAPILIQAPIIGVLYAVFLHPSIAGHANALLTAELGGVPLGASLVGTLTTGASDPATCALFGAIVLIIALVAEGTRRAFRPADDAASVPGPLRLVGALQFTTAVVATMVPLAAAIYLVVTVSWTLGQRLVLRRIYPLPS